ncbi:voltage-dependent T-type calcium channel subunit alpha-1I-like [Cyclopterus lumpus]|uniref:voltage-dependent T-type calcium channel subunit alpha-1I-like n=1 Tax=Cyclopterus lumpus TaxID=8103 RepID=UPI001485C814|nr:voltage-dependent T-type calcium channel subunit alpha-1I-like [Cyclopterus lumpus]
MLQAGDERSSTFQVVDSLVVAFFVLEMLVKMLAKGCFGYQGSYLGNRWHRLDLFINCGVLFGHFMENVNFHFQICRVLGPMRLVSRVTSIRDVFAVLMDIFPMLLNVLFLYLFVVHIFGVMGVQLWAGLLRNRCFLAEDVPAEYKASMAPYYTSMYDDYYPYICSTDGMSGMRRCHNLPPSVENGQACTLTPPGDALGPPVANACVNWNTLYNICRAGDLNPSHGAINFDNIGYAWIAIFQVITMEGWSNIMFYVMDAYSFWCFVFFVLVTIMGSFIMMNVCAVVIATQFSDNLDQIKECDRRVTEAASISGVFSKLTGCLNGIGLAVCSYLQVLTNRRRNRVHHKGAGTDDKSIMVEICTPVTDWLLRVVRNKIFDRVIIFAVFLSILTMAAEHHDQPMELTSVLRISNNILTVVFVVEMVLKLVALRWLYFKDNNNLFDFFIVIISLWETITKVSGRLSVLRVLRFGRMLHFFPHLKKQLLVLKRAMVDAAPLCLIMLFFILLFSLIGRQLFGKHFEFRTVDGDPDRKNFDTMLWSMVTVFQILTEEDWNLVLYNMMEATSPWAAIYFVAVLVTGKHVLLNVLVGIVIQGFQDRSTEDGPSDRDSSQSAGSSPADGTPEDPPEEGSLPTNNKDTRSLNWIQKTLRWFKEHEDWSFYMLSPQNRFRIFCQRVIVTKIFNYTVLAFIVLNCITIAMERPGIKPGSTEKLFLKVSSYIFSAVFLVEMLFKVLALGLLVGPESYCRSAWNVMDGLLVILSFANILVSLVSKEHKMLGVVKVLRLLRTFRPLRVIKRAPKLKLAVEALIAAVKPIGNITLICCAFIFFYAILGVQLFKGKFDVCIGEFVEHITNKTDCLSANYRWERKFFNFDSLPQALMSLFAMYSKDSWVHIMYNGLDAVGVDQQPVMNHNEWVLFYFIPFMIMSFFLLDMFIGVMVDTFHQCQQKQKRLDEAEGTALHVRGRASYSRTRRCVHALCTSRYLDLFMAAIIGMSVMVMALEHYGEPQYITQLTECCHYVFTLILIGEVLLKVVAFGGRRFLRNSWNLLDLVVVFVSVLGIVVTEMKMTHTITINPSILRVGRVLKLAQVLKAEKIRVLLTTVIKTLAQVGNICLLFIFFFYVYAALGVELFGELECVNKDLCRGINEHVNFESFGIALLALFQVCTGDNWSVIMKDTMTQDRQDSNYLLWVSPIFFISFVIMAQFVLVNLVVAVIMQAMEDSKEVKEERVAKDLLSLTPVDSTHREDRL